MTVSAPKRLAAPAAAGRQSAGPGLTALLAMAMALGALGVDLMLPAFGAIRADFGLAPDSTQVAALVTTYLVGLAAGQLVYGVAADRFGRRRVLFVSFGIYAVGALAAALAPSLATLLVARFLWGTGAAGSRVVAVAVVRDSFKGERMARAMSLVMAVFILIPVFAPWLGAVVLSFSSWRWVFGVCVVAVAALSVWAVLRLPETLRPEDRLPLQWGRITQAAREVVTTRQTAAYGLAMAALYGAFTSYLASSELIARDIYGWDDEFPLLFGGIAMVMGVTMLINARLVGRVGARRLAHRALLVQLLAAIAFLAVTLAFGGRPPVALYILGVAAQMSMQSFVIPNFNAIAMVPMGHIAGTASSVIGAVQLAGGAALGSLIDRLYNGTLLPLTLAYVLCGTTALLLVRWAERGRPVEGAPAPIDEVAAITAEA